MLLERYANRGHQNSVISNFLLLVTKTWPTRELWGERSVTVKEFTILGRGGLRQNTNEFPTLIYYVDDMFQSLWAILSSQMYKRKTI